MLRILEQSGHAVWNPIIIQYKTFRHQYINQELGFPQCFNRALRRINLLLCLILFFHNRTQWNTCRSSILMYQCSMNVPLDIITIICVFSGILVTLFKLYAMDPHMGTCSIFQIIFNILVIILQNA